MKRIQRKRTTGWKMPANAVYVGRPTKWGNPWTLRDYPRELCLKKYESYLEGKLVQEPHFLDPLKGKDLACWCPLDKRCHADVLLKLMESQPK